MITDFITISKSRNFYLEFQYEDNQEFEKYLRRKVPLKHIKFCGVENDVKWKRKIKYIKVHQKYLPWLKKSIMKCFVNVWYFDNGITYDLKTGEKITKRSAMKFV